MKETLEKFLKMPITETKEVFDEFLTLKGAIKRGGGLKSFVQIPDSQENKVILVAPADMVLDKNNENSNGQEEIELVFKRSKIDPLGVDDRARCAIVWLLKDLEHSILITS